MVLFDAHRPIVYRGSFKKQFRAGKMLLRDIGNAVCKNPRSKKSVYTFQNNAAAV